MKRTLLLLLAFTCLCSGTLKAQNRLEEAFTELFQASSRDTSYVDYMTEMYASTLVSINEREKLIDTGYDMDEISHRLAFHYITEQFYKDYAHIFALRLSSKLTAEDVRQVYVDEPYFLADLIGVMNAVNEFVEDIGTAVSYGLSITSDGQELSPIVKKECSNSTLVVTKQMYGLLNINEENIDHYVSGLLQVRDSSTADLHQKYSRIYSYVQDNAPAFMHNSLLNNMDEESIARYIKISDTKLFQANSEIDGASIAQSVSNNFILWVYEKWQKDRATILKEIHDDTSKISAVTMDYPSSEIKLKEGDHAASFPGGFNACSTWISENLHYPETAAELGVMGRVYVTFVVDKSGSLRNVSPSMNYSTRDNMILAMMLGECKTGKEMKEREQKVIDAYESLKEEAARVVKSMPKWEPAVQDGKIVNCYFHLPITFRFN